MINALHYLFSCEKMKRPTVNIISVSNLGCQLRAKNKIDRNFRRFLRISDPIHISTADLQKYFSFQKSLSIIPAIWFFFSYITYVPTHTKNMQQNQILPDAFLLTCISSFRKKAFYVSIIV